MGKSPPAVGVPGLLPPAPRAPTQPRLPRGPGHCPRTRLQHPTQRLFLCRLLLSSSSFFCCRRCRCLCDNLFSRGVSHLCSPFFSPFSTFIVSFFVLSKETHQDLFFIFFLPLHLFVPYDETTMTLCPSSLLFYHPLMYIYTHTGLLQVWYRF